MTKSLLGQYGFDLHIKSEKKISFEEGQKQIIANMLSANLTDTQIKEYTKCTQEFIDAVRLELANMPKNKN